MPGITAFPFISLGLLARGLAVRVMAHRRRRGARRKRSRVGRAGAPEIRCAFNDLPNVSARYAQGCSRFLWINARGDRVTQPSIPFTVNELSAGTACLSLSAKSDGQPMSTRLDTCSVRTQANIDSCRRSVDEFGMLEGNVVQWAADGRRRRDAQEILHRFADGGCTHGRNPRCANACLNTTRIAASCVGKVVVIF